MLIQKIEKLKNSPVKKTIGKRMKEFEEIGKGTNEQIFSELCFCIMTANFNAKKAIEIQNKMRKAFCILPEKELAEKLKEHGHRFPNTRAKHISKSQKHSKTIKQDLKNFKDGKKLRNWLADNITGLGMKEASHFLRNIGYKNVAIIDFHIIDLLEREKMIERPKTITKRKYEEIEKVLENLGKKVKLSLAELDLYLWFMETGTVLK